MKTYTDKEIFKALECCIKSDHFGECFDNKCPMISEEGCKVWNDDHKLLNMLYDLIKRRQAEIERLQAECDDKERAYTEEYSLRKEWQSKCSEVKSEFAQTYEQTYEQAEADILGNIADGGKSCHWCIEKHKAEAIKEFAERLKEKASVCVASQNGREIPETKSYTVKALYVDSLVKEMTEERK